MPGATAQETADEDWIGGGLKHGQNMKTCQKGIMPGGCCLFFSFFFYAVLQTSAVEKCEFQVSNGPNLSKLAD